MNDFGSGSINSFFTFITVNEFNGSSTNMNYYYFAVVLTVFSVHFISAETDHGKNENEL